MSEPILEQLLGLPYLTISGYELPDVKMAVHAASASREVDFFAIRSREGRGDEIFPQLNPYRYQRQIVPLLIRNLLPR